MDCEGEGMSTSADYRAEYHSRDERGDLYIVRHKTTGEIVSPRPMPHEFAMECIFLCGDQWTNEDVDRAMKRLKPVPIDRVQGYWRT